MNAFVQGNEWKGKWNGTKTNTGESTGESAFVLSNSSQSSENTRRISSFEVPVVEWNETSANAEDVQESAFTANVEIVLKILNPASVQYTVKGESHYVTIKQITLKNNVKN